MNYIDFHIDTLMYWLEQQSKGLGANTELLHTPYHVDFSRLIKSGYKAQFFACFLDMGKRCLFARSHYEDALFAIDKMYEQIEKNADVNLALTFKDYIHNNKNEKLSCFLSIEEGGILENDITRVDTLYEKGVRAITLTWNYENCIGYPHEKSASEFGLKKFGFEVIERMEDLGILIDISHLSDAGFWDVYKNTKNPFLATHSNARSVHNHSRNLTDDMICALSDRGGITGLNFYGPFLQGNEDSTIKAMLKHITHIVNVGGEDVLALGSDFDGVDGNLELKGVEDIHILSEAMEHEGFSNSLIEKICYKNGEDFLKRTL